MAKPGAELADFLRMKRQLLRPEMIGLVDAHQRFLADLEHRSDVAAAVGVTQAYYECLESGSGNLPSEQVLRALINVLQLTEGETAEVGRMIDAVRGTIGAPVHPQLMALLDSWPMTPAFVSDNRLTVLSSNPIARVLSPLFDGGTNLLRALYLDPNAYSMIRNTADIEGVTAAWAKKLAAEDPPDVSWTRMVGEISLKRPQFRDVWESDVDPVADGDFLLDHPAAGKLDLYFRRFRIEGCDDQFLVTLHAEPGSPTQCGLRLLTDFASRDDPPPW
jgi:transcriptional regulator with XRE-family HTH domain